MQKSLFEKIIYVVHTCARSFLRAFNKPETVKQKGLDRRVVLKIEQGFWREVNRWALNSQRMTGRSNLQIAIIYKKVRNCKELGVIRNQKFGFIF